MRTAAALDRKLIDAWAMAGEHPGFYAREVLGMEPTLHQDELFMKVAAGHKRIAARSGHGIGKTSSFAVLILWFLHTRPDCLAIVTAAKEDQIKNQIWAEARLWLSKAEEQYRDAIVINAMDMFRRDNPDGARALGRVARKERSETLQGFHHDHLLVIGDEASGIDDAIFEPVEGMLTKEDNRIVLGGNPTKATGYFHDCFTVGADMWECSHFSSEDSPLVTEEFVQESERKYGRKSNFFRVRVRGEFPTTDAQSLIGLGVIESALERFAEPEEGEAMPGLVVGLDPGRSSEGDASALVARSGARIIEMEQHWLTDSMDLVGRARSFRDRVVLESGIQFLRFGVDTIGLGGPIHDRLVELGEESVDVNVALPPVGNVKGFRPKDSAEPKNVRAELWLEVMGWLKEYGMIPPDHDLAEALKSELAGPRYKFDSLGRVQIEDKETMKKRGVASPNLADALCLTFSEGTAPRAREAWI